MKTIEEIIVYIGDDILYTLINLKIRVPFFNYSFEIEYPEVGLGNCVRGVCEFMTIYGCCVVEVNI